MNEDERLELAVGVAQEHSEVVSGDTSTRPPLNPLVPLFELECLNGVQTLMNADERSLLERCLQAHRSR